MTGHPALEGFEPVPYEEIWDSRMVKIEKMLREQYADLVHFRVLREEDGAGEDPVLYRVRDRGMERHALEIRQKGRRHVLQ